MWLDHLHPHRAPARPRAWARWLAAAAAVASTGCAGWRSPAGQAEPAVQHLVAEDRSVRIDELRVRGQTQTLTVTPKQAGAPAYQIVPANRGQDLSQQRGADGQRVWPVLSF